jgi:hypothetical protein
MAGDNGDLRARGSRQGREGGQGHANRAVFHKFRNILQICYCIEAGLWHRITKFYRELLLGAG